MKKLAVIVLACGIAVNLASVNAAGFGKNQGPKNSDQSKPETTLGIGSFFSGNTEGKWAYQNAGDLKECLLGLDVLASGKSGGKSLDLSGLDCLEYLVIKGGNGYVVLNYDQVSTILGDNKLLDLAKTALRNRGGQVPDISHWAAYGCKSVPEPSSVLASLGALAFGAFMLRRRHTA